MSTLRYATARADKSREYSYNKEKNHKLYTGWTKRSLFSRKYSFIQYYKAPVVLTRWHNLSKFVDIPANYETVLDNKVFVPVNIIRGNGTLQTKTNWYNVNIYSW